MKITIVNCFDTYEHRVVLLKRVLEAQGHQVSVVVSDFRHIKKCRRTEHPHGFALVPAIPYHRNLSLDRLRSHRAFAKDAIARAASDLPEVLWVLAPPNSLVKYAALYKKERPDTALVLDFIDMWPETLPIAALKRSPPCYLWRKLRDDHVGLADAVVAECDLFRRTLEKHCREKKVKTLYLARDIRANPSGNMPPEGKVSLCYLGSINHIIDIPCIGRILRQMDRPTVLHIIGDGERREELCDTAQRVGAEVVYHGLIYDRKEKQEIFDSCHAGLNIMKKSVFVGLTMKSLDYFGAALPVINNIPGDTWDLIEAYPVGHNYISERGLLNADIMRLQETRDRIDAFYHEHFSEKVFSEGVREIIEMLGA